MLPLGLFRDPTFSAAILTGLLINIAYYGLIFLYSLFFQQGKGYSPLHTGAAFLPLTAVEPQQSGVASGALNATRQSGSVIGVALYGALITGKHQLASGARVALYISATLLVLALDVVAVYVRKPAARLKDRPAANPNRRISPEDAYSRTGRRALEEAYPPSNLPNS